MPLTTFQAQVCKLLSKNRSVDSHLAGGAALHFAPNSARYSLDLNYFHDSEKRVSEAFLLDRKLLESKGYACQIEMNLPGYIRAIISKDTQSTKIEWAKDSEWRFMPVQKHPDIGFVLDPIDLAINKILALAGRDEARDYLDVIYTHQKILPLGAQIWAACGKDPGLNPLSLLELIKRRGKYQEEEFKRLHLREPIDLKVLKKNWQEALEVAEHFIKQAPFDDMGCLFYSLTEAHFLQPDPLKPNKKIVPHYGKLGGVLPKALD